MDAVEAWYTLPELEGLTDAADLVSDARDRATAADRSPAIEAKVTTHQVSQRIVREPRILGGEPTVKGTRVPVRSVVLTHRDYHDIARVCDAYPMLDRAAVEETLAFYKANREEIDGYIAENEAEND